MDLFEHQAKELFAHHGVAVPRGRVAWSPEEAETVAAVIQEDADAVGLSIHSGAHMTLFPRVVELLHEQSAGDVLVFGGGIIPRQDVVALKELGVAEIFTPGTPTRKIVDWLRTTLDHG